MINILTAILNENINYMLKEYEDINVQYDDIQYEEGLIEIIDKEKNSINYIVINEDILEQLNIDEFINKINKINRKIAIIQIKNTINFFKKDEKVAEEIIKIISEKEKRSIYKNNTLNMLKEENEKIKEEIKVLKNIIENNKKNKLNENIKKIKQNIISKKEKNRENKKESELIVIAGETGVGKTVLSSILGKKLSKNNKVLIIDMDLLNKDMQKVFKENKHYKLINNNVVKKISENLDIIFDMDLVINDFKTNKTEKLDVLLNKLLEKYEYIIIDLNYYNEKNILNYYFSKSNKILFIIEGNLLNIEKSKFHYDELINFINKGKIKFLLNKINKYSINKEIIEKLFKNKIYFELKYTSIINKFLNLNGNYNVRNKNIDKLINKLKEE